MKIPSQSDQSPKFAPAEARRFGLLLACLFTLIAVGPLVHGGAVRFWSLGVAALMLAIALLLPKLLIWPYRGWMAFGNLLHHIVSPLVMGLLFYCVFTPAGLIMRAVGRGPLELRWDKIATTYWIAREQPAPAKDSMKFGF